VFRKETEHVVSILTQRREPHELAFLAIAAIDVIRQHVIEHGAERLLVGDIEGVDRSSPGGAASNKRRVLPPVSTAIASVDDGRVKWTREE